MKKILSITIKLLCWTIASVVGSTIMLAFMLAIAEGDMSKGLLEYLM